MKRAFISAVVTIAMASTLSVATVAEASALNASSTDGAVLRVGHSLARGASLASPSGEYSLRVIGEGRLEISRRGAIAWISTSGSGLKSILRTNDNGSLTLRSHRSMAATVAPSYLAVSNDGDLTVFNRYHVPVWQGGLHARVTLSSISPYSAGNLFSSTNPSVTCFTCQAADITGTAPPSNALDSGTDIDAMTGDFNTANALFDAPAIGGDLSLTLSYDAQLAQSELHSGTGVVGTPGLPFGYGWSADFMASINTQSGSTPTPTITVDQGNGSQVTFTQSLDYGTSTLCQPVSSSVAPPYSGDLPTTNKYTLSGSDLQWCAPASVQGQLSDNDGTSVTYETDGGASIEDFAWDGELSYATTAAAQTGSTPAGLTVVQGVAGASTTKTASGVTLPNQCPSGVTCTIVYSSDARDLVEEISSTSHLITTIIDPSGASYTLGYTGDNLTSVDVPNGTSTPSAWNYAYSTAGSPYSSDITEIEGPDYNASVSTVAHTTSIAYYSSSSSEVGMVSSLVDGTGATTGYVYTEPCTAIASTNCAATGQSQQTTITYPAEALCPSTVTGCGTGSPVEVDQYSAGLETSSELGSTTNAIENETWKYVWNYGDGTANTSEVVTYPDTLNVAKLSTFVAPIATIISDPSGNVVSTTNALGDVSTSAYNDVGANNMNELLWSFPGPSNNSASSPPTGSYVYTYNSFGGMITSTDPLGNSTSYGYYTNNGLPCFVVPPSVNGTLSAPAATSCTSSTSPADQGAVGAPTGATTYSYDVQGDEIGQTVDANDTSSNASPQTTTAQYDVMGNRLLSIPAPGQSGVQTSANPYCDVNDIFKRRFANISRQSWSGYDNAHLRCGIQRGESSNAGRNHQLRLRRRQSSLLPIDCKYRANGTDLC